MNSTVISGDMDMYNILFPIKIILFIFCMLGFLGTYVIGSSLMKNKLEILFFGALLCYVVWSILSIKTFNQKYIRMAQIVENSVFAVIIAGFVITSVSQIDNYKVLFLIIMLISTIQLGMRFGMFYASISSAVIIFDDICKIQGSFLTHAENDLILIATFFLVVSVVGLYIKNYNRIVEDKNKRLRELINIIDTQNKGKIASDNLISKYESNISKLKMDSEKNVEFLSNIIHDLKTPLNVIFSALQVLKLPKDISDKRFSDKYDKYINIMKQNCYRLMKLINNILDITKINSGFLKLNTHNRNIVSVVEDIVTSVAPYVESNGINIVFDTNVEEKIMAMDCDKIERVILNLLSNSIKFTRARGKISVNIIDKVDNVSIIIADTGIGIPQDKIDMVFGRFSQVEDVYRGCCEGSGIGLYLVKSFVELHGGKICIDSQYGFGSKFTIDLPAYKIDGEDPCEASQDIHNCGSNKDKIKIELSDITM